MPSSAAVHAAGAELVYEVWYAVHLLATYPRIVILLGLVAVVIVAVLFAAAALVDLLVDAASAACARAPATVYIFVGLAHWAAVAGPAKITRRVE
jgi:hypothetical protein